MLHITYNMHGFFFVKDMIFGWCVRTHETEFIQLSDLTQEALEYIGRQFYPVYIPEDFKISVLKELMNRKTETNKEEEEVKVAPTEKVTEPDRKEDHLKLYRQIISSITEIDGNIVVDLPYFKLRKIENRWVPYWNNSVDPDKYNHMSFDTDELIQFILRKWW